MALRRVPLAKPSPDLLAAVLRVSNAEIREAKVVQSLWSGYGQIVRVRLSTGESIIVKSVEPPAAPVHPRGHATDRSHQRKLRSYDVEMCFYRSLSSDCSGACIVPQPLHLERRGGDWGEGWLLVLEDLDQRGFPLRKSRLDAAEMKACIAWLAGFHARFIFREPEGLWQEGSYWHLETRPDELSLMPASRLKEQAHVLDHRLRTAKYRTLIHGDAKVANFCFPRERGETVAAVDFQYVGGGVGTKDVAYFLSSVLDERECERQASALLDGYFRCLRAELERKAVPVDGDELEQEWRELYPVAWADFTRFLAGWAPGHAKMHGYSQRMTELALGDSSRASSG